MYLDSAYVAKVYLKEADSAAVRRVVERTHSRVTSAWALCEVHSVFHRHMREGTMKPEECRAAAGIFQEHVQAGVWTLLPVTEPLLRLAGALLMAAPADVFLRAGDALHLTAAREAGESEIWTNDRRMLAAAPYFGMIGRSV